MGSHYIPVGKIKIDKEILDIVCPAAGYDETPPPPEIYCPVNGYIPEYDPYTPQSPNPTNDEEIILYCDDLFPSYIDFKIGLSAGNFVVETYDESETLIVTNTFPQSAYAFNRYDFPTSETGTKYILKIYPETPGNYFWKFQVASSVSTYTPYLRVFHAKFKTPNISDLSYAFQKIKDFKGIEFFSELNSLSTFSYAFQSSGIKTFIFPNSMPVLTEAAFMFENTPNLNFLKMDTTTFPELTTLSNFLKNSQSLSKCIFPDSFPKLTTFLSCFEESRIKKVVLPSNTPLLTTMEKMFYNAKQVEEVQLPTSWSPVLQIMRSFMYGCGLPGEINFPEFPSSLIYANRFAGFMPNITKIKFNGNINNVAENLVWFFGTNTSLREIELPYEALLAVGWQYIFAQCPVLKKAILPNKLLTFDKNYLGASGSAPLLEEVTGNCENDAIENFNIYSSSTYNLRIWDTPKFKISVALLKIGKNGGPLETFNVDWANSVFTTGIYLAGQLTAAKIDAIFTALPPVSGSEYIDIKFNPGAASCTPSIATAKGWTVINTV